MSDIKVWNKKNLKGKAGNRFFPTDMMLRAIFSDRYFDLGNIQHEGRLLDIGCLYANNMVPFAERGWEVFGTEVTNESVEIAKSCATLQNINADIRLGFNTDLPFESDKFDVLLSLATIHYEESIFNVGAALNEMSRVLKHDGCALIQTTAPQHTVFENSKKIGEHLYQLDMESDIRHEQKFVFFKDSEDFVGMAQNYFSTVEVARCTEKYPNSCIDVWLFKLGKK